MFSPKLTFEAGAMRPEDQHIAIYVVHAPFDQIKDMLGGLFCALEGPAELIAGDTRTPFVAQDDVYHQMKKRAGGAPTDRGFNGMLVWQPHEAPQLTVIEKPLDAVGVDSIYFPKAISQFDPALKVTAFHSEMEVKSRTLHGFSVRQGGTTSRFYEVSKGIYKTGWHEENEGPPLPWENANRLGERHISKRLDRALLFEYIAALGIDLERSLFGRDFAQSFAMLPLLGSWPHDDRQPTRAFQDSLDRARSLGIVSALGEEDDDLDLMRAYERGELEVDENATMPPEIAAQITQLQAQMKQQELDHAPDVAARETFATALATATTSAQVCSAMVDALNAVPRPHIANAILKAGQARIATLGLADTNWLSAATQTALGDRTSRDAEEYALMQQLEGMRDHVFGLMGSFGPDTR